MLKTMSPSSVEPN